MTPSSSDWWIAPAAPPSSLWLTLTLITAVAFCVAGMVLALAGVSPELRSRKLLLASGALVLLGVASVIAAGTVLDHNRAVAQQSETVAAATSTANLNRVLNGRYGAHLANPQAVTGHLTPTRPDQLNNVMLTLEHGGTVDCNIATTANPADVVAVCNGTEPPRIS